ncbi:hypothetical protein J7K43_00585, partial [Candidatus Calescamantes bacterium]|nr:hypothetical protein [Candidatus Calescamantes bacterium]
GLATATKYNGVWAILFPFLFHFTGLKRVEIKKGLRDKKLLLIPLFFFIGFFIGCPYSILAFSEFKAGIFHQMNRFILVQHGDIGNPFLYHILYSLRYGMGTPLLLFSFISIMWVIAKRDRINILFLIWVISYYIFIAIFFKSKFARHMLPILPFLSILVSGFFLSLLEERRKLLRLTGCILSFGIILYTFLYTFAYDTLYTREDPRTQASQWIEKNIPPHTRIGVLWKPYFYTPPIINMEYWVEGETEYNKDNPEKYNQYEIIVLKDSSMKETQRKTPDFIVLSEYEYRDALRFPEIFSKEKKLLNFIQRNYTLIEKFENLPSIGKLKFRKGFPPHDWLYPYPAILIYKYKTTSSTSSPQELISSPRATFSHG